MRTIISLLVLLGGIALAVVSYFFLAAPLGQSTNPEFSNPRLPFAPALFILGVILVFLSAVTYELLPEKKDR
jgi:hypothetical protein